MRAKWVQISKFKRIFATILLKKVRCVQIDTILSGVFVGVNWGKFWGVNPGS